MLPAAHRLRRSADISRVTKAGVRARRGCLVVHAFITTVESPHPLPARMALAVGRSVGNSVVRHRVSRRLRAIGRGLVGELPAGCDLVIRALPQADDAEYWELERDLRAAVAATLGRAAAR